MRLSLRAQDFGRNTPRREIQPRVEVRTSPLAAPAISKPALSQPQHRWPIAHIGLLFALWLAIFAASLCTPPVLDDADATHAQAAHAMLRTGDWVTLHVDGVRYLEKPPLPYWIAATSLRLLGDNAFAIHLPLALSVLGLALLGYAWSRRAFGARAAFYTALFTLTSVGVFLFTRVFIPDALLSLLLALSLYAFLRAFAVDTARWRLYAYLGWTALALAVLTKGLVALVFLGGAGVLFLVLTGERRRLYRLRPIQGFLLFLAIAAPWHILAGLRNKSGANGHGFFWFYFINEHVLRFLGRRIPADYNKLPATLYWSLHLVWLFPWSLFAPATIVFAFRKRRQLAAARELDANGEPLSRLDLIARHKQPLAPTFANRTVLLLAIFAALVLLFFACSTNQEYYTFPAYLPLLMLLAAAIAQIEVTPTTRALQRAMTAGFAAFAIVGLAAAATLAYGLYRSRHAAFVPDIGTLLAHRDVGHYTLSMSHFFDLTAASFAALRLPAFIAAVALAVGPLIAWMLHARHRFYAAMLAVAFTSTAFLIAAHIALVRFSPMLSSKSFADRILTLERAHQIAPDSEVLIYGDQAFGSSIPFYLDRQVLLVDGRSTSMLFGSTFADAPPIFLTHQQLLAQWGTGPRKRLFVPLDKRSEVDHLLGPHAILLDESSGKALITDRLCLNSRLETRDSIDTTTESPGR
jgi:4-amino-4-deoxy-L-arabinose transferase-like glycosyltransferase